MITEQHIKEFKNDGFTLVKGLYTAEEMQEITQWTDAVSQYLEIPGKYMMYSEQSQLDNNSRMLSRIEDPVGIFMLHYTSEYAFRI